MDLSLFPKFICPHCGQPLRYFSAEKLLCDKEQIEYPYQDDIWRLLQPEREEALRQFIQEYELVRRAEGRGSDDPQVYRGLPFAGPQTPLADQWRIRGTSYKAFVRTVLAGYELKQAGGLQIVDMGAGNGWLSNRLAQRGHHVAAVDLVVNTFDGLGCKKYYETSFVAIQAEFDHLPFDDQSADLVIFNASAHYSSDLLVTLAEAARVVRSSGAVVILDSPVYHEASSGLKMAVEREEQFLAAYGTRSNALQSENFLTYQRLDDLVKRLHLSARLITPYYGLKWLARPWKARLAGQREPAAFHIIVLTKHL